MPDAAFMDKLTALCKRRGFIFQSSEIYGGIGGFWDYGPLGVELKRNIKNRWWQDMVLNPPTGPDGREIEMVGVDCSIIMNPKVWEASGHATGFADPMVDCRACKARLRADQVFFAHVFSPQLTKDANDAAAYVSGGENRIARFSGKSLLSFAVEGGSVQDALHEVGKSLATIAKKRNLEKFKKAELLTSDEAADESVAFAWVIASNDKWPLQIISVSASPAESARPCPKCHEENSLTEPRAFNLMFETFVGALQDATSKAYLRPETAQGIFANFKNVLDTSRVKVPFGIAQVGKAFRNEINPRNYTFRSREFEQMEIEFFCRDGESMQWYEFWRNTRYNWYVNLGLQSSKLRLRDQTDKELAHYSRACADIEYLFPFADEHQELEGVAHRGCFDLSQHAKHSGKDLTYFDEQGWAQFLADRKAKGEPELTKEQKAELGGKEPYRFLPTVIEPSAGADRATLAFLCEAYTEDEAPDDKGNMQTRVLMKFHPKLAPVKAAVFPLVNKEGMPEIAEKLHKDIKKRMPAVFDDGGAIGRRYRRQDEIGTPYCLTIDGETLKDQTVTIRHRDDLRQERVGLDLVVEWLEDRVRG